MTDPIIEALVQRRKQAGLSQGDIGERMGRTQGEVSRIEHGCDLLLSTLRRYADGLPSQFIAQRVRP